MPNTRTIRQLDRLPEGTKVRLPPHPAMPDVEATIARIGECSVTVEVLGGVRDVEFENPDGSTRRFSAERKKRTTWSPATMVEVISLPGEASADPQPVEELDMSKKSSTKKTKTAATTKTPKAPKGTKPPKAPKAPKAPKEKKPKKVSALDAAAQVLAKKGLPMNCKDLVEAMEASGLWKSPGGKTPHATLYSAIIREIKDKGKDSRFKKTDAGTFEATSKASESTAA